MITQETYVTLKRSSAKKENGGGSSTNDQDEIGERTSQGNDDGCFSVCEEGPGICAMMLTIVSLILIVISLPLSLFCVVKVVQVSLDLSNKFSTLIRQ